MGLWSTGFLERMEEVGLYKKPEMVEVVRCKDCRFGEPTKNMRGENRYACINYRTGIDPDFTHKPDWFCADGEKKDESSNKT